jgi:FAD/FMN-containing dehydrogenase
MAHRQRTVQTSAHFLVTDSTFPLWLRLSCGIVPTVIENFGGNVVFEPQVVETPRTEAELLACLVKHRGQRIRVAGRLHAWSDAVRTDDVSLNLRYLNDVRVDIRPAGIWATVGGGCQLKRVLSELDRQAGATTPSLGLITEQAIAGAIATGTHGSGRHSLSHYISKVRLATYDPATGEPMIRAITEGPELRAARCSLGSLGVIVSVGFWCRPRYRLEERFARYADVAAVLAAEDAEPLQQFYLVPWMWAYYAQHRHETAAPRSWLAGLYAWYCYLTLDVGLHLCLIALARYLRSRGLLRLFYRSVLPWTVIRGWRVVDWSERLLIMEHELFRHIEIEAFVRRRDLVEALAFTEQLLRHADGEPDVIATLTRERLTSAGVWDDVAALVGRYRHHYPICVRKVLPDDTLLSMAADGDEPWYAISFACYFAPGDRAGFFQFAKVLTDSVVALYQGRVHWGKSCPLTAAQAEQVYPQLPEFRRLADRFDSTGAFRNEWVDTVVFGKSVGL